MSNTSEGGKGQRVRRGHRAESVGRKATVEESQSVSRALVLGRGPVLCLEERMTVAFFSAGHWCLD